MKKAAFICLIFISSILNGCVYVDKTIGKYFLKRETPEEKRVVQEDKKKMIKDRFLQRQVQKGDENFNKKNYEQARKDYLTMYYIDPTNDIALQKLRRLPVVSRKKTATLSPTKKPLVLTGKHVVYTVKAGDTLAIISREFYGDPLKYTVLAEANDIQYPYILHKGQSIIVPGTVESTDLKELEKRGKNCFIDMNYDCTIREFTAYLSVEPENTEIKDFLKRSYHEEIKINYDSGNYNETKALITDLKKVALKYKFDLVNIENYIAGIENNFELLKNEQEKLVLAENLIGQGGELQNKGMLDDTLTKYHEALKILNPLEQAGAVELRHEVEDSIRAIESKELSDKVAALKNEAVKDAYNEEYEGALAKIKEASSLDPENEKVFALLKKIKNIVSLISKAKSMGDKDPEQAFLYYKKAHSDILEEFKQKSSRVEKEIVYVIHKLQKAAENKLNAEDPCESLRILDMILKVNEMINIPYFIKNELQEIYSRSSSLKEAIDIKCN